MDSRRNPVIDALKYRVFHVPGLGPGRKLRLFYKTRNVSACFWAIFDWIGNGSGGYPHRRGIPGRRIGAGLVPNISAVEKKVLFCERDVPGWWCGGRGGGSGREGTPKGEGKPQTEDSRNR